MVSVKVNIQPEMIKWALKNTHALKIDKKNMADIEKWLDGTKSPTFNQIEKLSQATNIPFGYFFLQSPPVEQMGLLEYRTVNSTQITDNPSRELVDTIYYMQDVQEWFRNYRQDMGFGAVEVVACMHNINDINLIVSKMQKDLDLQDKWFEKCTDSREAFNVIRGCLESCGILVMMNGVVGNNTHRPLNINEFRAFAMIDNYAPLIFVNAADSNGARLFSLVHEAAHIWLGENNLFNDKQFLTKEITVSSVEGLCNAVAGEFLVPKKVFLEKWSFSSNDDVFFIVQRLAKYFRCGEVVVARKALDCGLIDKDIYNTIVNNAIKNYKLMKENKTGGGNYYNNLGSRLDTNFVKAVCESIGMGRITYTEAYRLTNTNRKTFSEMVQRVGGVD